MFLLLIIFAAQFSSLDQAKLSEKPSERSEITFSQPPIGDEINLISDWKFFPFKLLKPGDPFQSGLDVILPHLWHWQPQSLGFATYRNVINLPNDLRDRHLAIYMPDVYSSYQIWIDGKKHGGNGSVGSDEKTTKPMWLPKVYSFIPKHNTVEIIIQISNFHHSKGGIGKMIVLGENNKIAAKAKHAVKLGELLFFGLLFIAFINFRYYIKKRHKAFLYFFLFCMAWAVRTVFSNIYIGVLAFETMDWNWVVRLEYLSLYLSTLFGFLVITELFPLDFSPFFKWVFVTISTIFCLGTIVTSPLLFTAYVQIYLAFSTTVLIVILFVLVKAFINDRVGATPIIISVLLGVVLFAYVILSYQYIVTLDEFIYHIGFLALFLLMSASIRSHVKHTKARQMAIT
jgi:hypothetical protein